MMDDNVYVVVGESRIPLEFSVYWGTLLNISFSIIVSCLKMC